MAKVYEKSISQLSNNSQPLQRSPPTTPQQHLLGSQLLLQQHPLLLQQQQNLLLSNGGSGTTSNLNTLGTAQTVIGGMSSFDDDSLPDYSEFDSESVTLDYFKER